MPPLKDLTGQKFGKLTVISRAENKGKQVSWNCLCDCGNQKVIVGKSLTGGLTNSCGCIKKEIEDLTNRKFGKTTVLKYMGKNETKNSLWLCQCECGSKPRILTDSKLKNSKYGSCGCISNIVEKRKPSQEKDLMKKLQNTWNCMKSRCYNENAHNYKYYGGKGVKVCDEWRNSSSNFYQWALENGVEIGLTIDRIDVNGNYEPNNCRWITMKEQSMNKTSNKMYKMKNGDL